MALVKGQRLSVVGTSGDDRGSDAEITATDQQRDLVFK